MDFDQSIDDLRLTSFLLNIKVIRVIDKIGVMTEYLLRGKPPQHRIGKRMSELVAAVTEIPLI